ncbi:MAG: ParB/RepB/Spo0J family partition protein [Actinomycetota bacterium]|nr:ParB/RepB/Spo0J family partition protein [Actinomycetota bacterium]
MTPDSPRGGTATGRAGGSGRRSGLGRGLDALLPPTQPQPAQREGDGFLEVAVDEIEPNPDQPRRTFDESALEELAGSIGQLGVLQPLLLQRRVGGRFELVAGERRLRAARLAGLDLVPAVIVQTDPQGSLERALVENLHRADLNPIEEGSAYRQLIDEGGLTQEALAGRLGLNRVSITNALRLLDLPISSQKLVAEGRLSAGHGKALLGLQGNPFQERLARRAVQEGLSVRETEDLVRRYGAISETGRGGSGLGDPARPPLVSEAQRRLADHLQTRVRVEAGKRKGMVTIDFVSLEELDRLMRRIIGESPAGQPPVVRLD